MIYRWLRCRLSGGRAIADLALTDASPTPIGASKNTFTAISKASLTWRDPWTAVGITVDVLSSETWMNISLHSQITSGFALAAMQASPRHALPRADFTMGFRRRARLGGIHFGHGP
jgi:hypothetical protein